MKVVAAKPARSAMAPRPTEGPVLESVEHFPREREITRVSKRREGGANANLPHFHLPFDQFDRAHPDERSLADCFHGLLHLFHVGRKRGDVSADPQRGPTRGYRGPQIFDVKNKGI